MPLPALADVDAVEVLLGDLVAGDAVPRVRALLDMASAAVRRFTHQTLSAVPDDAITLASSGTAVLVLPERPVTAVGLVALGGGWLEGGWLGRFTWDAFGRLQRLDGLNWGPAFEPVDVIYSHGFDPVPEDIVGLVAAKVAGYLAAGAANPEGLKSLQIGAMSETYANAAGTEVALGPGSLTGAEREALRSYRLGSLAAPIGTQ